MNDQDARTLAEGFVVFMETGEPPAGLFTADVFCDFTMPHWRLQSQGLAGIVALRKAGHPGPGRVPRWRHDPTPTGFVIEFDERWEWDGHEWTSREMAWADVEHGAIASISVYCTGDWDEALRASHAKQVQLLRP